MSIDAVPSSLLALRVRGTSLALCVAGDAKWLLWHVSELDLYLGVAPFAALLVLALSWRRLDLSQRAFVAAAAALSAWMVLEVAAFASLPTVTRVEERNMFYVVP